MRKLGICILGPMRSAIGGVSTHLNQIFGSDLASEFELTYFSIGGEGRKESRLEMITRLAISPFTFSFHLLKRRPDVVHINTSLSKKAYWRDFVYLLIGLAAARKIVYQVHGGELPANFFHGKPLRSALLRWVLQRADAVVLLARSEMAAYQTFAPKARLHLIPNSIDPTPLLNEKTRSPGQPLFLAYIGRLEKTKGLLHVLQAIKILSDRNINVHLTIGGNGTQACELRTYIAEQGLQDRTRILGSVYGASRDSVWHQADIFAFPTFHREGLPYSLLEAMAAGAVPVTSRAGAIEDVVLDGVNGILVPAKDPVAFADAVESLHNDRAQLLQLSRNAVIRVKTEYSVRVMQQKFRDLYLAIQGEN